MLYYCQRHDLAFCKKHLGQCLSQQCNFLPEADCKVAPTFCSVCVGVIAPDKAAVCREQEGKEDAANADVPLPRGSGEGGHNTDAPRVPRVPRKRRHK